MTRAVSGRLGFYTLLSAVLLLGLLVRIVALFDLKSSIYGDFLLWDEQVYHRWAMDIAGGALRSGSAYALAPLPAYLMALVYRLFGPDVDVIRYANIGFGVLTCLLIYGIGRRMGTRTVGLVAALAACCYEPLIFYSIVPLKTALSVFLFAATVYFLLAVLDDGPPLNALWMGVAMGLITNVRPNAGVWLPVLALAVVAARLRNRTIPLRTTALLLGLYAAGLTVSLAPFAIGNHRIGGEARPAALQGGIHVYLSNQVDYPKGVPFSTTSPTENGIQFTIEASRRTGRVLTPGEASAYWTRRTLQSMAQRPLAHAGLVVKKTLAFFNGFEKGDHYHIGFMSRFVPIFKAPWLTLGIVLPLGLAGMALTAAGSAKLAALATLFWVYAGTLVVFFTNTRMRLPLVVILIPFAVLGLKALAAALRDRRLLPVAAYGLVAALVAAVSLLPTEGKGDMTAYLNTHAIILQHRGETDAALGFLEASSARRGKFSAYADLALASFYLSARNFPEARKAMDRIPEDGFAVALKHEKIGDWLALQNRGPEAVTAYREALFHNAGLLRPRRKLIRLCATLDPAAGLREYERLQWIEAFYKSSGMQ